MIEDGTLINTHRIIVDAAAQAVSSKRAERNRQGEKYGCDGGQVHQSQRNAIRGSTRVARMAGMLTATAAMTSMSAAAAMRVRGSTGDTPNRYRERSRP